MNKIFTIAIAILVAFGASIAMAGDNANVSVAYSARESTLSGGSWDYAFDGAGPDTTNAQRLTLDGTWVNEDGKQDGTKPGQVGAPPNGDAPGGVAPNLVDSGVTYWRLQDTGDPTDFDASVPVPNNYTDPSNRKPNFTKAIGSGNIISDGVTISMRARIATDGTLDDEYREGGAGTFAWPAGGLGSDLNDDARAMFGISQPGEWQLGFSLALDANTPQTGATGGLVTNNRPEASGVGTASATSAAQLNLISQTDAALTGWNEYWITAEDSAIAGRWTVNVWVNGNTGAPDAVFEAKKTSSGDANQNGIYMGRRGGTSTFAMDVDFFAVDLGVTPAPEPSTIALCLLGLAGLGFVRRR